MHLTCKKTSPIILISILFAETQISRPVKHKLKVIVVVIVVCFEAVIILQLKLQIVLNLSIKRYILKLVLSDLAVHKMLKSLSNYKSNFDLISKPM